MASGHVAETLDRARQTDPTNLVRGFLLTPPDEEPGTAFAYNQPCTYALAAIVQRRAGQSLVDYLRPRLFKPLGIAEAAWIEDPPGRNIGFSGLHATGHGDRHDRRHVRHAGHPRRVVETPAARRRGQDA